MSTSAGVHVCTAKGSHVCQWGSQVCSLSLSGARSLCVSPFVCLSLSLSLSLNARTHVRTHSRTHSHSLCATSDIPRQRTVKIFCPKCDDIYFPKQSRHMSAQCTDTRSRCRRRLEQRFMVCAWLCRLGWVLLWDYFPAPVPPHVRGSAAGIAHREVRGENLRLQTALVVQRQLAFYIAWQTLIVAAKQRLSNARGSQFDMPTKFDCYRCAS